MSGWIRISCREAQRLFSQRHDAQLGGADRLRLRLHLLACTACSRVARQFGLIAAATRRIGPLGPPGGPPDA
jgi:hypothetical protein